MNKQFGQYLREKRKTNGLTLRSVEQKTGVSNAYLSQLENNKISNPSPSVLHNLILFPVRTQSIPKIQYLNYHYNYELHQKLLCPLV